MRYVEFPALTVLQLSAAPCDDSSFISIAKLTLSGTQAAIAALNSLQTNFAIVEELKKSTSREDINKRSLPETVEWLRRIGYKVRKAHVLFYMIRNYSGADIVFNFSSPPIWTA